MRRLARRLFTLCSAVSLLLCVAACVLWGFAPDAMVDTWWTNLGSRTVTAESFDGEIHLTLYRPHPAALSGGSIGVPNRFLIFGYGSNLTFQRIAFPPWFGVLLTASLPGWWLLARTRRNRAVTASHSLCHICGYDLRATPDRCPECGAAPPRAPADSPG